VIQGWRTLQAGEQGAQDAKQSLLTAAARGVPMYTQGLRMLIDGLQLLAGAGGSDEIHAALEKARKYGDAADWSRPTTTFLGASPQSPSLKPTKGLPRGDHPTRFVVARVPRRAPELPSEQVSGIGLILAGTGAHGAYEAGVLMELLPRLEEMGQRPSLIVGMGMGAFNAAFLGATAHLPAAKAADQLGRFWQELKPEQVMRGLSISGFRYLGGALGVSRLWGLLDPAPLADTLKHSLDWQALHRNVANGQIDAVAVVATQASTSRAVVFVDGPVAGADAHRGIDYVRTQLSSEHVLASAAIPLVFPAVQVATPSDARGWYFDGAVKLKTPIKPALALGASRVVAISMNPSGVSRFAQDGERPDFADGALHLLQAAMTDSLNNDIETLAVVNAYGSESPDARIRRVPYIFVAPSQRREIGELALNVYRERYGGVRALRSPDFALLARLAGRVSSTKGELLSYIFFSPDFLGELVKLGQADARRWTWSERGSDAPWRLGPRAESAV
jgi:NTE family protein